MELSEFIKETLLQIAKGIRESQQAEDDHGAIFSPAFDPKHKGEIEKFVGYTADSRPVYVIDFDVTIEVVKDQQDSRGGKISVGAIFSVGSDAQSNSASNSTSKIQFHIPFSPPIDPGSHQLMVSKRAERADNLRNRRI